MHAETIENLQKVQEQLQRPKYRVVLYGMGAAIPEVYELDKYETAKQVFFQSTDGICYRKAFIVKHGPHASWEILNYWGYADGPLKDVAHA